MTPPPRNRRRHVLLLAGVLALVPAGEATALQWLSRGPYGATILAVAVDPVSSDHRLAGGFSGLFRSTSGGSAWSRVDSALLVRDIGALAFAAGGTAYVGTLGAGVYRSIDGGQSFEPANTGIETEVVFSLATDGARVWAGSANNLFLSTDSGTTWVARSTGIAGLQVGRVLPIAGDTLLVATGSSSIPGGVFRTTDAGLSWSPSSSGLTNLKVVTLAAPPDRERIYAGTTFSSQEASGVYVSVDRGASWSAMINGLTNTKVAALLVDPLDPERVYAGTQINNAFPESGLYRSADQGMNWDLVATTPAVLDVRALAATPQGELAAGVAGLATVPGGVYGSADGLAWSRRDTGIAVMRCRAIATSRAAPALVLVGAAGSFREPGGVYLSEDRGVTWSANTSSGMSATVLSLAVSPATGARRYAGTSSGVHRWNDAQGVWEGAMLLNRRVTDLMVVEGTPERVWAATDAGVHTTTDGGASWVDRSSGITDPVVQAVAVDPTNPAELYAGTATAGVFRSLDTGMSWSQFSIGLPSLDIRDLVFDADTRLMAATAAGVQVYEDTTWVDRSAGLTSLDVRSLSVHRRVHVAGTAAGVYRSDDAGVWEELPEGLPPLPIHAVRADTAGGRLRFLAATGGDALYLADQPLPITIAGLATHAAPGRVELVLRTGFESDVLGLHIFRSAAGESRRLQRTHELLTGGPDYRFVDVDPALRAGEAFDYHLLAVGSRSSEEHGPFRVVIPGGVAPIPTPVVVVSPNPFRGSTWIEASTGRAATLRIVDVTGQTIHRLDWPAGRTGWRWDGTDGSGRSIPAGVYWIELRDPTGSSITRRVVRLR